MYSVYLDGQYLIYSTSVSSLQISDVNLVLELGKAGTFDFTIHSEHPEYNMFNEMLSIVTVVQDSQVIFYGRVFNIEKGINNDKRIMCEGVLSYLLDSFIEPHTYSGTLSGYFSYLISQHNLHVESSKTFSVGVVLIEEQYNYSVVENDYKSAWELLNQHFCNDGGYLHLYLTGDGTYIDVYNETVYNNASQEIRFGKNLVDINIATQNEDLYTCIVPLGAKPEGSEQRITIKALNNQVPFLVNTSLANQYGRIFKTVIYDDITDASTLYQIAVDYVDKLSKQDSAEITAVDMSYIDDSVSSFNLNDLVNVYSEYHFDSNPQQFLIKKIEIDIQNPANNKVYAGIFKKGITDLSSSSSGSSVQQSASQPYLVDSGTSGIWTWAKYSDGTAECFGKINVTSASTGTALGSWYRTASMYGATDYPYPVEFSEAPATNMQFHTRNEQGALIWSFSTSAEEQQQYLPQCYLIRPTQSEGINGNINIIARGKYDSNS